MLGPGDSAAVLRAKVAEWSSTDMARFSDLRIFSPGFQGYLRRPEQFGQVARAQPARCGAHEFGSISV
jgi:hypothetical protein